MGFTSYAATAKTRGFGMTTIKPEEMTLRISTSAKGKQKLVIRLGSELLKKAKFTGGDTIDLLIDSEAGRGCLAKSENGWKLKTKGSGSKSGELTLSWNSDTPFKFSGNKTTVDPKRTKGGIEFGLPD